MKVISVKFKENGRAYYFDPGDLDIQEGGFVIVTTARGTECGQVVNGIRDIPDSQLQKQLKVLRTGLGVKPGTQLLPFSALTKQGRDEIWAVMDEILAEGKILPDGEIQQAGEE